MEWYKVVRILLIFSLLFIYIYFFSETRGTSHIWAKPYIAVRVLKRVLKSNFDLLPMSVHAVF